MPCRVKPVDSNLQPFNRGIDEPGGAADRSFLAEHMPRLQRLANLKLNTAMGDGAVERKPEFTLRIEPHRIEWIAGVTQVAEHAQKVLPNEMPEHESIMQRGAPAHQRTMLRFTPEPGDQRAQQKLLRQAHPCVGRHF